MRPAFGPGNTLEGCEIVSAIAKRVVKYSSLDQRLENAIGSEQEEKEFIIQSAISACTLGAFQSKRASGLKTCKGVTCVPQGMQMKGRSAFDYTLITLCLPFQSKYVNSSFRALQREVLGRPGARC